MIKLQSCKKLECGRCEKPEDTIARLEAIIGAKHDYWMWEEEVAEHLHWSAMMIEGMDFRSMGKGITPLYSKAGALAEGAEWLTARPVEKLPGYQCAHQDDVEGDVLPIEDLLAHVESVTPSILARIKQLSSAQHWVNGYSLIQERPLKVPIEYVDFISGPNGKAAGNRLEEAIVHAANEVFERRAHITVLRNRMVVPTIDIDSIDNPIVLEHIEFLRDRDIDVTVKDLSFGGNLPCIGAYFADRTIPKEYQFHHFFKVGAAFNLEEALIRTFTEYTQGRKRDEFIDGSKSEQDRILNHDFRSLKSQPDTCDNFMSTFMFGFIPYRDADFLKEGDVVPFDRGQDFGDCLEDIEAAKSLCQALNRDLVVVDFTDPEIGFPVAQVIIPGYSDVLPFHPHDSEGLFKRWTRSEVIASYTD
ncbi:MAG: YcaO-like family protein [Verrucomicrobia bacterium]|nr:YcaO-like family protein [Verrucomicrobiota bacterium]